MRATGRRTSLAQHYLRWLISLFLALCLISFAAVLAFVMLPLAQRSADDLAGLMVLSAQTWAELPPQTRPEFEAELLRQHQLTLQPDMELPQGADPAHGFYMAFLEQSLERRNGLPAHLSRAPGPDGADWLWASVTTGERPIAVGLSVERMNTRPLWALAIVLLAGTALASVLALWLARRIAQPVARLEQAAADLAAGTHPTLLAQTGPRELAELAGHFNQMSLQVRELLDARTTLLAGLSHDLRTPLARMRLALELLTLKPEPSLIARLEQDIGEMSALIGQLLDLAKGLAHEDRQTLDCASWLRQRVQRHAAAAQAVGATLQVNCPAGLVVQAAPGLLGRLLDNLVSNALQYAPGPIEVLAQTVTDGRHPAGLRLSVLDRGPGIAPEHMAAVWRPFQRVEGSRSRETGGYGLGLAVVDQLAKSQGWRVGLAGRNGGGLEAWVELPGAASQAAAPHH